jgi:hypothetical protein
LSTLIGLASALLVGQPAVAETASRRLAVLELKGGNIQREVLAAFEDAVRGGAVEGMAGRGVDVITSENMLMLLREMGKTCTEGDCEVETARNIGADFVVSGSVARIDDAFVVTLKLHETKRGSLLATSQTEAKSQLEVLRQLREHGRTLAANNIGPRPATSVTQTQPPAVTEPRRPVQSASSSANGQTPAADTASRPGDLTPATTGRATQAFEQEQAERAASEKRQRDVERVQEEKASAEVASDSRATRRGWGIAIAAVGVAAGGVAGVFAYLGSKTNDDLAKGGLATRKDMSDTVEKGQTYNTVAWAMMGVGCALVAIGSTLTLASLPQQKPQLALGWLPEGGAVAVIRGAF